MYYRLHNRQGDVVGFMRVAGGRRQFVDAYADRWHLLSIPYADRVRIEPPISLRMLKGCRR
jgi:hypothetical protein